MKYMHGIRRVRRKDKPFFARLIYSDNNGGGLLKSAKHDLQGKPDYVYKSRFFGRLIVMELKSGAIDEMPHQGDVMQLAAYFMIVEEAMGQRPKRGLLRYRNAMFVVKNTSRRRREVRDILAQMRHVLHTGVFCNSPDPSFVQCRHCLARGTVCRF